MNHILLYGGGLDSTALLGYLVGDPRIDRKELELIHVNYGQKAAAPEIEAMIWFATQIDPDIKTTMLTADVSFSNASILRGNGIGETPEDNVLELRNLVLISLAASYASTKYFGGEVTLYLGFHREPENSPFLDAQPEYLEHLSSSIRLASNLKFFTISTPFINSTRQQILQLGWSLLGENFLNMSHTCYEETTCGVCVHCKTKEEMVDNLRRY